MKFTLSWLKDHLETEASLEEICERLTAIGLEVEDVDDKAAYKPFVIAKILTAEKHPEADRLKVLTVDAGDGKPVQIVCGAPNARAGMIGALARPGTYVPGIDVTLSVGKIRGVESHGMMCSEKELNISDDHNGIIDLPEDAPVGTSFASYAGLDDPVIEINLTPNRPDCTSVFGIARDLAASGLGTLKAPKAPSFKVEGETPHQVKLELEDHLCPGFAYRLVRGVKNGPSPKWMQQRLLSIGLRPISALVDVTNYMTFDQGRPMHVFDADKVKGALVVRRAKEGEEILALDTRTYKLNPANVIIADDNGPESIGGIMGGEHSGCDENTVNVLIESALWDRSTSPRPAAPMASSPMRAIASSVASIRNTWCRAWSAQPSWCSRCAVARQQQPRSRATRVTRRRSSISLFGSQAPDGSDRFQRGVPRDFDGTRLRDPLGRRDFGQGLRSLLAPGCRRQG